MKKILVLGAGRSSGVMIDYLVNKCTLYNWTVSVADVDIAHAQSRTLNRPNTHALQFDITEEDNSNHLISEHDIVISMLPPALHDKVAVGCLKHRKHLLTASYISPFINELKADVENAGLLFLCEMGLDPGIDHMSAMKVIHDIEKQGGTINSFKSYCGGLVAPESDDNPWHYKISWNPRNVVLAGQGGAKYLYNNQYKYAPYQRLFKETEIIDIAGYGLYEAYPNRDSLLYKDIYGLKNISTLLRGTLRKQGYCAAWQALVDMGYTDDSYALMHTHVHTYSDVLQSLLPRSTVKDIEKILAEFLNIQSFDDRFNALKWLGILKAENIPMDNPTPAKLLQYLLEENMILQEHDKDLVVMRHEIGYANNNKKYVHTSTMTLEGENSLDTAMAQTVGLPLAFMTELLLTQPPNITGVHIPVMPEIYEPVLNKLEEAGIIFKEDIAELND